MRWFPLIALAACSQSQSPVRGSFAYQYADGTRVPIDLRGTLFQAYVEDAAGFAPYPAEPVEGRADGTFELPAVPDGPFLLRRSGAGYYGVFTPQDDHEVVETIDVLGRPGAQPASTATRLQLDLMGMAQWQPSDRLVLDCVANATELYAPAVMPAIAADATEIHGTVAWGRGTSWGPDGVPYLMDAAGDDLLHITRQSAHVSAGVTTRALTQLASVPAPTQTDGGTAAVSGAFVDVPATERIEMTVRGDALASLVPAGTVPSQLGASLVAGPATGRGALLGPELASVTAADATSAVRVRLGYGNPFEWSPAVGAFYDATREVHVDATHTTTVRFTAFSDTAPLSGDTYTFTPLLGLDAVTLAGASIDSDRITVPHQQAIELSFDGPTDFTRGRVIVWRADRGEAAASVDFDHVPVALPPDIFQDSARYTLQIDVFVDDGHGHVRTAGYYSDAFSLSAQ